MKVVDPGHYYLLEQLDAFPHPYRQPLVFVKRVGDGYPGNEPPPYSGTNMQEVLRALIDRIKYLDNQIHDPRNNQVLYYLRGSIFELEMRAAERHGRMLPLFDMEQIENIPTCVDCGHIGCNGECHKKVED